MQQTSKPMKQTSPKFIYTAYLEKSGSYSHPHVCVFLGDEDRGANSATLVEFTWQGDNECDHWYAYKATIEIESRGETALAKIKSVTSILGKLDDDHHLDPIELCAKLESLNIPRRVYDCRLTRLVPLNEIADPDAVRWYDDYSRLPYSSCRVNAVASPDVEQGQKAVYAEFCKRIAERDYGLTHTQECFEQWIKAGKPVAYISSDKCPDITPVEELFAIGPKSTEQPAIAA